MPTIFSLSTSLLNGPHHTVLCALLVFANTTTATVTNTTTGVSATKPEPTVRNLQYI
jgi:hypothetical protein